MTKRKGGIVAIVLANLAVLSGIQPNDSTSVSGNDKSL